MSECAKRQFVRLCECGCGEPTFISDYSDKRRGTVKGQPNRRLSSHGDGSGAKPKVWDPQELLADLLAKGIRNGECLEWPGFRDHHGYGQVNRSYWRRPTKLHRAVMDLIHGGIPEGACVLHSCDNPPCYEPAHLRFGTKKENTQDMLARRRNHPTRGEDHPHAKLTSEQVAEIRARYRRGGNQWTSDQGNSKEIAEEFGITPQYVAQIARGDTRRAG